MSYQNASPAAEASIDLPLLPTFIAGPTVQLAATSTDDEVPSDRFEQYHEFLAFLEHIRDAKDRADHDTLLEWRSDFYKFGVRYPSSSRF